MSSRRRCHNPPDSFCYICGEYTLPDSRKDISDFVKRAYLGYFGCKLGDQDKEWAPHIVCKCCVESLRHWTKGKRKSLSFGIPMVWREQQNHFDDCYFCLINLKGINKKNKHTLQYPNIQSAIRPVPHCEDIPVPIFSILPELTEEECPVDPCSMD